MIERDFLEELTAALSRAVEQEKSLNAASRILKSIGQLSPNQDLRKALHEWLKDEGQNFKANTDINFVPGDHRCQCRDLLIGVCAGRANFDRYIMQTIEFCINCRGKIKAVIIATDDWSEKYFNKSHKQSLKALHKQFGTIFFVFTPHAGTWKFNRIIL